MSPFAHLFLVIFYKVTCKAFFWKLLQHASNLFDISLLIVPFITKYLNSVEIVSTFSL